MLILLGLVTSVLRSKCKCHGAPVSFAKGNKKWKCSERGMPLPLNRHGIPVGLGDPEPLSHTSERLLGACWLERSQHT